MKEALQEADTVTAGAGWEFCSSDQADQWYDFHMDRWKDMDMAGFFFRGLELHRRRITSGSMNPELERQIEIATGKSIEHLRNTPLSEQKKEWTKPKAEQGDAWQPIETAPQDGTSVLISSSFRVGESSYGVCRRQHDGFVANGGYPCWRAEDRQKVFPGKITHWMPLPNPPAKEPPKPDCPSTTQTQE